LNISIFKHQARSCQRLYLIFKHHAIFNGFFEDLYFRKNKLAARPLSAGLRVGGQLVPARQRANTALTDGYPVQRQRAVWTGHCYRLEGFL
jgi:hypothetical protein